MKNSKTIFTLASLLLFSLVFSSCRKKLKGDNLLYEGTWTNGYTDWVQKGSTNGAYIIISSSNVEYEKKWIPGNTTITIEESGKGSYDYYNYSSSYGPGYSSYDEEEKTIDGKVKLKNDEMTIKFLWFKEEFNVTTSPTNDAMGRFMVLDSDTFRLEE